MRTDVRCGIQAGFCGNPIGAETLAALKEKRFELVRVDLQPVTLASRARGLILEVQLTHLQPMVIVRPDQIEWLEDIRIAGTLDVELSNEPDLNGPDPIEYTRLVENARVATRHRLWVGAVSNLNQRGLAYLSRLPWKDWPPTVGCSVHWYPHGWAPTKAHPGFHSREAEVEALGAIIGNRPWGVSEFGYHTAWGRWGILPWRLTDAIVSGYARWEWAFWGCHGAGFAVWYQLNDGVSRKYFDHFGLRRRDGSWKPVAFTVPTP